jgi:hypothetical protein
MREQSLERERGVISVQPQWGLSGGAEGPVQVCNFIATTHATSCVTILSWM